MASGPSVGQYRWGAAGTSRHETQPGQPPAAGVSGITGGGSRSSKLAVPLSSPFQAARRASG